MEKTYLIVHTESYCVTGAYFNYNKQSMFWSVLVDFDMMKNCRLKWRDDGGDLDQASWLAA